jgi:hypothetical protein
MSNESIKKAIKKYLENNNIITEEFYRELSSESENIKSSRENINESFFNLKKYIIKTNFNILIDKIFKEDKEGSLNILKGIKNRSDFFDFLEEFSKFLILFEKYNHNYEFNSPDLAGLKETFALKDEEVYELIREINLDNE